jgi:hypothetical protein
MDVPKLMFEEFTLEVVVDCLFGVVTCKSVGLVFLVVTCESSLVRTNAFGVATCKGFESVFDFSILTCRVSLVFICESVEFVFSVAICKGVLGVLWILRLF